MTDTRDTGMFLSDDDWMRVWQSNRAAAADTERTAREIMARVWRFDQKVFWRNAREYAAGMVLLVVFAGQLLVGRDRGEALVGIGSVGFVMAYLWWKHRGLQPLDPAANILAYRTALLARYDDQIRLLRSVPYWYLLPLFFPSVAFAASAWPRVHWEVLILLVAVFALIGWLNVSVAVRTLRAKREKVVAMFPQE